MEREQLEEQQATLRGMRDTLAGIIKNGGAEGQLAECIDALADVVDTLVIKEQLVAGEHANAVSEMIKRDGERPRVIKTAEPDARD